MPIPTAPNTAATTSAAVTPPHWPTAATAASGTTSQDQGDLAAADVIRLSLAMLRTYRRSVETFGQVEHCTAKPLMHGLRWVSTSSIFRLKLRTARVVGGGHMPARRYPGLQAIASLLVLLASTLLKQRGRSDLPGQPLRAGSVVDCPGDGTELTVDKDGVLYCWKCRRFFHSACPRDGGLLVAEGGGAYSCQICGDFFDPLPEVSS